MAGRDRRRDGPARDAHARFVQAEDSGTPEGFEDAGHVSEPNKEPEPRTRRALPGERVRIEHCDGEQGDYHHRRGSDQEAAHPTRSSPLGAGSHQRNLRKHG